MIATVTAENPIRRRFVQFHAIELGLETEPVSEVAVDVIFHDKDRMLNLIKRAGGKVSNVREQENVRG